MRAGLGVGAAMAAAAAAEVVAFRVDTVVVVSQGGEEVGGGCDEDELENECESKAEMEGRRCFDEAGEVDVDWDLVWGGKS